ncbi:hypothetical protein TRFO_29798 [Tritrichomonas foetus]|uniref:Uncharacterized protein n=1 Tax=Tritrichomonas foetus TaxID=1144522 RepID=A0A1J4JUZ8_9EUKA|nr:hypothetical protein TRFO_29798 [Tritrichomonas foetus]|eukprot:OHT02969.1 hypothetical protein TRFO_29798 [Tritrichomonas foetus]
MNRKREKFSFQTHSFESNDLITEIRNSPIIKDLIKLAITAGNLTYKNKRHRIHLIIHLMDIICSPTRHRPNNTEIIMILSDSESNSAVVTPIKLINDEEENGFISSEQDSDLDESESFVSASDEDLVDEHDNEIPNPPFFVPIYLPEENSLTSVSSKTSQKQYKTIQKVEDIKSQTSSQSLYSVSDYSTFYSSQNISNHDNNNNKKNNCYHSNKGMNNNSHKSKKMYVETQVDCDDDEYGSDYEEDEMNSSDRRFIASSQYSNDISIYRLVDMTQKWKKPYKQPQKSSLDFDLDYSSDY